MDERSGPLAGARDGAPVAAVSDGGLSAAEAAERLARYGLNELPRARRTPLWRMIADQVRDPLVMVLLVAAVLTLATGDLTDAGVILLVIVVNTTAGVTQEVKAGQAIAALSELTAPDARVLRDGAQRTIPVTEVVPGDLLVLAEGDIVPADADADADVTDAAVLLVDESALTGESVPTDKLAGRHAVSAGTTIVRGRGQAVVTATGSASAMGRMPR
jgi:Ca2+-transporting ATPase